MGTRETPRVAKAHLVRVQQRTSTKEWFQNKPYPGCILAKEEGLLLKFKSKQCA